VLELRVLGSVQNERRNDWGAACGLLKIPIQTLAAPMVTYAHSFAGLNGAISNRMVACYADIMDIEQRNQLRAQAGLPLLDVVAETARLIAAREEAEFERLFEQRRPALCHQWTGNQDGWMTNMGRWSLARQLVRDELRAT
jgi:hypothetical protein